MLQGLLGLGLMAGAGALSGAKNNVGDLRLRARRNLDAMSTEQLRAILTDFFQDYPIDYFDSFDKKTMVGYVMDVMLDFDGVDREELLYRMQSLGI
jgi:hypothetical protein